MGTCICSSSKPHRGKSYELSPNESPSFMTKTQYIKYLLRKISQDQLLGFLLHHCIFNDINAHLDNNYWPDEKKISLIRNLQDYIKLSYSLIYNLGKQGNIKIEIDNFGEVFGREMHKLQNQVQMQCHWMAESLDYSAKFCELKFNFEKEEIMGVLREVISLCEKDMLSMFYLSSYLVKCCENMEKEGKSIREICEKLKQCAVFLKNETAVDQMKKKQATYMNRDEETEQMEKIKGMKVDEKQILFYFNNQSSKQLQIENQILDMVDLAKANLPFFNQLLYAPCIQNQGFGFKSNLKLTSKQNRGALHRVKQKLLKKEIQAIAKLKQENEAYNQCKKLSERVAIEQSYVNDLMLSIYQSLHEIPFTVSDLLRGKCLFNKIAHINKAVLSITQRVQKESEAGRNIRIVQVDNRLGKYTKDLVLKIKISELVCQFQMALFFKQAENEINHKMYQLSRSKIISEIGLLYEWQKKGSNEYFSLMANVLPFSEQGESLREKMNAVCNTLQRKRKEQKEQEENYVSFDDAQMVGEIKSYNLDKEKVNILKENCRLRTLHYYIQQKQEENALSFYKNYNDYIPSDQEILSLQYNCLGSLYKGLELYQQSLDSYFLSLSIKQKMKGKESLDYAQTLNNIGLVYVNTKRYPEALKIYEQSLTIKQLITGKDSIDCSQTLNNIGLVYDNMKKYPQALSYYFRSLQIKEKIKGKDSIDCAQTLNNIALVYNSMNKYAQALDSFSRSLLIKEKVRGKNSMQSAQSLNNIGTLYRKMGKLDQALDYYERSMSIKGKVKGQKSLEVAQCLLNIGLVYELKGDMEKAIKVANECCAIKKAAKGDSKEVEMLIKSFEQKRNKMREYNKQNMVEKTDQKKKQQINMVNNQHQCPSLISNFD